MRYQIALVPLVLLATAAQADPITENCLTLASAEACACATEMVSTALPPNELAFYAGATGIAAEAQASGANLIEAWNIATDEMAQKAGIGQNAATAQLNRAGQAHRDAIDSCNGG
ncbi:hypothetical protein CLV78_109143 [Aliiruegeria haliotis]|uniref:Uncharacterized protein n=1 Tax=Aliiruegeria haliotis TaxID=1280846 RepID=A0A2T0RK92_9RHOB|nr:hypothetical protein [Aliiruegeria haliotis]PRY21530.1 hypothetical protein CLV78_109143 [Aliiruegeria haliotis]